METISDSDLVQDAGKGDNEAIAELFRRHHPAVVRYARSLSNCATTAEDLASEAFTRTLSRVQAGTRPTMFRAYIFTAVRNVFFDQLRRGRSHDSIDDDDRYFDDVLSTPDPAVRTIEELSILTTLATLAPAHRAVLQLAILDGHTNAEIAERLGMTPNAAASLTYRARQALQIVYSESGSLDTRAS